MKVILIDDEKAMHFIMNKLLAKIATMEVVGEFYNTASATQFVQDQEVDLAFVDINMPEESGVYFAKRMAKEHPHIHIVFVTSNKDFALDAYDLFALDYIVKPVSINRLEKTIEKAIALNRYDALENEIKISNKLSVYVLGGLEVHSERNGYVKFISRKSAELFGYLLLHRGRMVSRTKITTDVFGGMPLKNAETYLNTAIYQLRKSLEPHGYKHIVKSDNEGYGLELAEIYIDSIEFEKQLTLIYSISTSNINKALDIEQLYRGELFGEKAYFWSLNDVERLTQLYSLFVKRLGENLLQSNESRVAIRLLSKLLSFNELDEDTVKLLMMAYTAQNDYLALSRIYENYHKILHEELGISPSPEFVSTYMNLVTDIRF